MEKDNNIPNQIKIGANTRVGGVISYILSLFNQNTFKDVTISAIGGAIGTLVNVVEVVKAEVPNLHQNNKISTVSYQTLDPSDKVVQERLYPKMETVLSILEPKEKGDGYQKPLEDNERKAFSEYIAKRRDERKNDESRVEGSGRGRGFGRGRGRGFGRGFSRGDRGGFSRGDRGGFSRGDRGGFSRGDRAGFSRGDRGGFSRGDRGGFSRGDRGGFSRGDRGGFSRGDRGGFSRGDRGGFSRGRGDRGTRGGRGFSRGGDYQ